MANKGCYIKSPFDIVMGTLRTFNVNTNVSDPTNYDAQYKVWGIINEYLLDPMGQVMGKVPNVAGWQAFYQTPSFHEYWINSTSTQKRFQFLQYIFDGFDLTNNGLTTRIEVDCVAWIQQFSSAICQDPNLLIAECIKYLLPIDLSSMQKDTIKVQTLLSNQTNNTYWTTAWLTYLSNPSDPTYDFIIRSRLKAMFITITQLAEYQLM